MTEIELLRAAMHKMLDDMLDENVDSLNEEETLHEMFVVWRNCHWHNLTPMEFIAQRFGMLEHYHHYILEKIRVRMMEQKNIPKI